MMNEIISTKKNPAAQFFSFSVPAILGMLLTSGIVIVDGLFIGRIIGETGLAGVNLTLPVLYLFMGIVIMTGVGGSVKAGHALGAGDRAQAGKYFTLTLAMTAAVVFLLTALCLIFLKPLISLLRAGETLRGPVKDYLGTILWFYPCMMMNILFSIFIRTEGKPGLSLFFGVAGNLLNGLLDYLMIARWGMGLKGAALASGISVLVPMLCGIGFYLSGRSVIRLKRFRWSFRETAEILYNGSSEMIAQLSIGITTGVFNSVILSRIGVRGVAVFTIAGYISFIQIMLLTGFSSGLGPIIGYCAGAGEKEYIRKILKVALISGFISGGICWLGVILFTRPIAAAFSGDSGEIITLAASGIPLFASAFLLNGFNILVSGYFTSLGKAGISALIALLRGLLIINILAVVLPRFLGDTGIWISYPLTEVLTLIVSAAALIKNRDITLPAVPATVPES